MSVSQVNGAAHDFGVPTHSLKDFDHHLGLLARREISERFTAGLLYLDEFLSGLWIHGLATGSTDRFVTRDVVSTSGTGDRGDAVRFVCLGDVDTVDACEFAISVLAEDGDVSRSSSRATHPTVVVFDMGLVEIPRREEGGAGLPEVRQRDGAQNPGSVSQRVERLRDHLIRDGVDAVEFRPQRGIGSQAVCWMVFQPVVDVRRSGDERDCPSALFAFDGDLQTVFVVLDVTDGEVFELTTPESGVELQRNHGRITSVVRCLGHGDNVLVPVEHLAGIGRRVVIRRRARGYPSDGLGDALGVRLDGVDRLGDAAAEDADGRPIVSVGFLVIPGAVDPGDDALGGVTRIQGFVEAASALGNSDARPEQLLVSVVAVFLGVEVETVAEGNEQLRFVVGDVLGRASTFAKVFDLRFEVLRHAYSRGNPSLIALPQWLGTSVSQPTPGLNRQVQSFYLPVSDESEIPNSAETGSGRFQSGAAPSGGVPA